MDDELQQIEQRLTYINRAITKLNSEVSALKLTRRLERRRDESERVKAATVQIEKQAPTAQAKPREPGPAVFEAQDLQHSFDNKKPANAMVVEPQQAPKRSQRQVIKKTNLSHPETTIDAKETMTQVGDKPSYLSRILFAVFGELLTFILARIFTPAIVAISKVGSLYRHYQRQGKAPVFLMTLVGLIALVSGFAYGLQYTFVSVLDNQSKVALGFAIGIAVVGLGIYISRHKPDYREYAASIISLGVIFNYLCAYFIGPYFGYVGAATGFALLSVITLASYFLAVHFETRIVGAVTLVGGIVTPFLLAPGNLVGESYAAYLLVLAVANLHLSKRIQWPVLAHVNFILTLGVLEYAGIVSNSNSLMTVVLLFSFFNLYAYYWFFSGLALKSDLTKMDLVFATSNVFYLVYGVLSSLVASWVVASFLLVNFIVFLGLLRLFRILRSNSAPLFLLMLVSMLASAFFLVAPINLLGQLWAIEALALLYIGFVYHHSVIRLEAYGILVLSMGYLLWPLLGTPSLIELAVNIDSWFVLMGFSALFYSAYKMIQFYTQSSNGFEQQLCKWLNEAFTLWVGLLMLLWFVGTQSYLATLLFFIPIVWCFYRAAKYRLAMPSWLAYAIYFVVAVWLLQDIGANHFGLVVSQSWATQLLLVEVIIIAAGLQWWYQRNQLESGVARLLRYAAVVLPILWTIRVVVIALNGGGIQGANVLPVTLPTSILLELLVITGLTLAGQHILRKWLSAATHNRDTQLMILEQWLPITLALLALSLVAVFSVQAMLLSSVLVFVALLFYSVKQDLLISEIAAWCSLSLLVTFIIQGLISAGSFHLSDQLAATKLALTFLLSAAWLAPVVYRYSGGKGSLLAFADLSQKFVYLLLPVLFLPHVLSHTPNLFPVFIWLSVSLCYLLAKTVGLPSLKLELRVLFVAACLSIPVTFLSGSITDLLVVSFASLLALLLIHIMEKSLHNEFSSYAWLLAMSLHVFALLVFCNAAVLFSLSSAAFLTAVLYIGYSSVGFLLTLTGPRLARYYSLAWVFFASPILLTGFDVWPGNILSATNILAVIGLAICIHGRFRHHDIFSRSIGGFSVQLWLFQLFLIFWYSNVFVSWGIWSAMATIALVLHAVVLLFLTIKPRFKTLLNLSLILFVSAAGKLMFFDLGDYTLLLRMGVLMACGVIMMVAAFYYQKLTDLGDGELLRRIGQGRRE